uniref:Membrane protein-like protein n=1 Tax=mine drainage metagenome TaxID=410659 RepID=E6QK34_9ZZZZ
MIVDPLGITQAWANMFHLPVPLVEKIARPVVVYIMLVLLLRLFGKRELAQLNPFDLVVLLSLSNTVQNAIIGEDNSVTGGIVGAFALLAINWLLARFLFRSRRMTRALEGRSRVLVRNGKLDRAALEQESLTIEDLMSVLHRQGFSNLNQVARCELEPNGTFYVEGIVPSATEQHHAELLARLDALSQEVAQLKAQKN